LFAAGGPGRKRGEDIVLGDTAFCSEKGNNEGLLRRGGGDGGENGRLEWKKRRRGVLLCEIVTGLSRLRRSSWIWQGSSEKERAQGRGLGR